MKYAWQRSIAAAVGVGLMIFASVAMTQERETTPRGATKATAPPAKAVPSDLIHVNSCHVNLIDKTQLAATRAGVLAFVKPEEGHEVKLGEIVAKVKDEVAQAQLATAKLTAKNDIEIRFARKSSELAWQEHKKAEQSNKQLPGTITEIEMKRLFLAAEKADLQIENAQNEHAIAGSKAEEAGQLVLTHEVQSTIGGMVTKVYKRTGEGVREGDPIVDIVNTERMRVMGYVPFKDISRVKKGDRVMVKLDVPDAQLPEEDLRFEGKITFIDSSVEKVKPEVRVFAEVVNQNGVLRDGARAEMVIYPGKAAAPINATTKRDFPRRPVEDR